MYYIFLIIYSNIPVADIGGDPKPNDPISTKLI